MRYSEVIKLVIAKCLFCELNYRRQQLYDQIRLELCFDSLCVMKHFFIESSTIQFQELLFKWLFTRILSPVKSKVSPFIFKELKIFQIIFSQFSKQRRVRIYFLDNSFTKTSVSFYFCQLNVYIFFHSYSWAPTVKLGGRGSTSRERSEQKAKHMQKCFLMIARIYCQFCFNFLFHNGTLALPCLHAHIIISSRPPFLYAQH